MLLGPAGFDDRAVDRNMAPNVWNTAKAGTHRILVNSRFGPSTDIDQRQLCRREDEASPDWLDAAIKFLRQADIPPNQSATAA